MATINFAGNTYRGEVLEDLLVYTAHGNDTYEQGLIHIKPGVQKKFVLPHIQLGSIIQDNKPTPTSVEGAENGEFNKYTITERYLEPEDFMVYLEFNPRDFEEFWRPFQPEGPLVFRELDPQVQSTMLHLLIDRKDQYINDCIWAGQNKKINTATIAVSDTNATKIGGESAAGPMKYFDGALARVLGNIAAHAAVAAGGNVPETQTADAASGKVTLVSGATFTNGEQVETALYDMWKACPKHVRKSKELKFVMGWETWDLYDQYLTTQQAYKYTENPDVNKYRFKGKEIVVIDGVPEHTIFLGKFSRGVDSCLWMAVDYATDEDSVKVERLQANSELYFFQMRMKMDVNIVRPSEIVVWTAYTQS